MDDYSIELEQFSSKELKNKLTEIVTAINKLSKMIPVVGFHPKFYIPGWIGFFQLINAESKMESFASKEFCSGMDYKDFGLWICSMADEVVELYEKEEKDNLESQQEIIVGSLIVDLFHCLLNAWVKCCPEVSTHCNIEYENNTKISLAGLINKRLEYKLSSFGYNKGKETELSFTDDLKGCLGDTVYKLLGIIINVLTLVIIAGLIDLIF